MSCAPGIVSSVSPMVPISVRRSAIQFGRLTSFVGRDVALPAAFAKTARKAFPTTKGLAGSVVDWMMRVVEVAPEMSDHGPLRLGATCHRTVGGGVPTAAALI